MRFPECFIAAVEARELQRTIEKEIESYIGKRPRPVAASSPPRYRGAIQTHHNHQARTSRNRSSNSSGRKHS